MARAPPVTSAALEKAGLRQQIGDADARGRRVVGKKTLDVLLLDDLVGPEQERLRDRQAERLGRLEVDDQLELGGLFHR